MICKDPGMLATRPQFHWPDQKLQVHAFLCFTADMLMRSGCGGAPGATQDLPEVYKTCSHSWRGFAAAELSSIAKSEGAPGSANRKEEMRSELENLGPVQRSRLDFDLKPDLIYAAVALARRRHMTCLSFPAIT